MTTRPKLPQSVPIRDLQLGDVIRLNIAQFADAIVYKIEEELVWVERPYMTHANFSYTGGVIVSIGHENFALSIKSSPVLLIGRAEPAIR